MDIFSYPLLGNMTEKKERSEAQKQQLLLAQKKAYEKRRALAEAKMTEEEPEIEQETEQEPEKEKEMTPPPSPKKEPENKLTPPPSPKREQSPPPPPIAIEPQPSLRYERGTLMFFE